MTPTAASTDVRVLANHVGGAWTASSAIATLEDRDPATGDPRGKDSIDGDLHANGRDAVEFYTRKKVVTSRWAA